MEEEFYNYLISMGRAPNTANSYRSVINSISRDYSRRTNQEIDIYEIQEQDVISEISQQYSQNGEYEDAGNNGHAAWRNAIARYSEFFANRGNVPENDIFNKTKRESTQAEEFYNYLISTGRASSTANLYKSSINSISRDYSQRINQEIDIYEIQEQDVISEISQQYSQNGEYADAENNGIGTWRNAIARYSEFFTNRGNIATLEHNTINKTKRESTQAENILAWKEILSSSESKDFCASILKGSAELFGQTKDAKIIQTLSNIILMVVAFVCVGFLSFYELVPKGTTGVLSGIIIGYFFKKND